MQQGFSGGDRIGEVGPDHDRVGIAAKLDECAGFGRPSLIELDLAIAGAGQIAVAAVPLHVLFDEDDAMPPRGQRLAE